MDLWGPYKIPTQNGCHYFLTIVDDQSRFVCTYLLPNKANLTEIIENFVIKVQNQFPVTIKKIRTDNGSEFLSSHCQNMFKKFGIEHQHTCPYSPQQNGRVEIKHKHLL